MVRHRMTLNDGVVNDDSVESDLIFSIGDAIS
jgi:hypothetical protein